MEHFAQVLDIITTVIQAISIVVLLWGVGLCTVRFIRSLFMKNTHNAVQFQLMKAKIELGRYILLGLELLIVADIIDSIINPTWEDILVLASIVAIRTVISFFLNREIKETNDEIEDSEKKLV